jgi:ABC-type lipoprotein release transport system permease subunit
MDEVVGFTTLEAAQDAVEAPGALTQIGVLPVDNLSSDSVAASIRRAVAPLPEKLEVLTWQQAVPEMVGFIQIDDAFLYIYLVVIFAIVAFAIANTFLMAVMERVREFGLLNALGLRSGGVARLLLTETLLMTAVAMSIGFLLGLSGHLAANHWGIPVAMWGVKDMEVSGVDFASLVMRSRITPIKWVAASILVALVTLGSALYPAWRASRFEPAEAMRFYQ